MIEYLCNVYLRKRQCCCENCDRALVG
jgi:hypothetical protein